MTTSDFLNEGILGTPSQATAIIVVLLIGPAVRPAFSQQGPRISGRCSATHDRLLAEPLNPHCITCLTACLRHVQPRVPVDSAQRPPLAVCHALSLRHLVANPTIPNTPHLKAGAQVDIAQRHLQRHDHVIALGRLFFLLLASAAEAEAPPKKPARAQRC